MSSMQIGNLFGVGEARILRLFNKQVGKPLRRHLLEVKMIQAAELITNSARPIKTIAFDCGYSQLANFYRDFKRIYGMSPLQMRVMRMEIQLSDEQLPFTEQPDN